MKIAIIGGGISGLTASYLLYKDFDITLFEANDYIGGHTHTVPVNRDHGSYMVDTGFIVFNKKTYPNFCNIINELGVEYQPTQMTFSVKCLRTGIEYNAHSLNTFFAQRKNLFVPSHYKMILDIFRFRSEFDRLLDHDLDAEPLVPYLEKNNYSRSFIDLFILPITSSLWSAAPEQAKGFPLGTLVRFFKNHGFLDIKNPFQWLVVKGGSKQYVDKMLPLFGNKTRVSCPVTSIKRHEKHVEIMHKEGVEQFDQVIMATHSDQALKLLEEPTESEREILGAIGYQANNVTLHTDTRVLPDNKKIWASWNYLIGKNQWDSSSLTYDMKILQSIRSPEEFLVSLNQQDAIDPAKIIDDFAYHHPIYSPRVPAAQKRHPEISGVNRTHYCGAYWGYGFHEDGVKSALEVCRFFGKRL
jgi:predicted NAD/FAD-binding protein